MDSITQEETAWLAGIFEGEGYTGAVGSCPVVTIEMTDFDVIDRIYGIVGKGTLRDRQEENCKASRRWYLGGADAAVFLLLIRPWLGERRSGKVDEVLEAHNNPKKRRPYDAHCIHGHEMVDENTYVYGPKRSCKTCRRDSTRRSRERQKSLENLKL